MDGNLFRGSKSTSPVDEAPPRDAVSIKRYAQHLPFQVFCCESGVHIIDPSLSFYQGITYRSSIEHGIFNISAAEDGKAPKWSEGPCMDSAQMHFCRDLWMLAAREGVRVDAKKARDRERKGLPRGLSDEMEKIVKNVAPQYAPAERSSGGILGFGKKKPPVIDSKLAEDDEGEDWEEDEEGEEGEEAEPEGKPETPEQAEEKKEQAMAADAAAAALPVEEQHPAAGADAVKVPAKAGEEDQFVDPEAMLEKEAKGAAAAVVAKDKAPVVPELAVEKEKEPIKEKKEEKNKKAAPENVKRAEADNDERIPGAIGGNMPAAAQPGAQKADAAAGKPQVGSVNNADEADDLDAAAPPPLSPETSSPSSSSSSSSSFRNRSLKNAAFTSARILVNPRCVTTYAGVSHTQLALDLFGADDDEEIMLANRKAAAAAAAAALLDDGGDGSIDPSRGQSLNDKYTMQEYGSAAETFVCQEMRTSGKYPFSFFVLQPPRQLIAFS